MVRIQESQKGEKTHVAVHNCGENLQIRRLIDDRLIGR